MISNKRYILFSWLLARCNHLNHPHHAAMLTNTRACTYTGYNAMHTQSNDHQPYRWPYGLQAMYCRIKLQHNRPTGLHFAMTAEPGGEEEGERGRCTVPGNGSPVAEARHMAQKTNYRATRQPYSFNSITRRFLSSRSSIVDFVD